ncbi:MAG: bifunctional phosphoglucose/phosphomannose isomerase [Halobacteriales archaeon]|nr:bifunctional phosphoglucose/phosphomannose isomerase [Halobacteriales archaeon]
MLDDIAGLRRIDQQDMLGTLAKFPEQVRDAARAGQAHAPKLRGPWSAVAFAAMGGSAMGADMAALWLGEKGNVPCAVTRGYALPHWVGKGTLLVAMSYSGNTEETLACAQQGLKRGATLLAVTSGGELAKLAASQGDVLKVPAGYQPRAAVGHLAFTALAGLERLGLAALGQEAEHVAAHLDKLRAQVEPARQEQGNPAKQLARALQGKLPLVYAAGPLEIAARRFATQLNENPKLLAHWGPVPEVHHNELSAWFGDARLKETLPVVMTGAGPGDLAAREQATIALLKEAGVAPWVLAAQGDSVLQRVFHALHVGDWASVYLSCLLGRDPSPVEAIVKLKQRMAEFKRGS